MVLGERRTPHGSSSPAHAAAVAFLRGGLVAIVALLAPARLVAILDATGIGGSGPLVRLAVPALGFAAAGALGGAALGLGRRGVRAFSIGGLATGLAMSRVWPQLGGLTGHEPLIPLVLFATLSWALAFGAGGGLGAWLLDRRASVSVAAWAALGGAAGALLFVTPSLFVPLGFGALSPMARLAVSTITSVVGLLTPFAVVGAAAGHALDRPA